MTASLPNRIPPSILSAIALSALVSLSAGPSHAAPFQCPTTSTKRAPMVYAIGSSTMGSVLGKVLKKVFRKKFRSRIVVWGKASSGLARPDYHDWPGEVPGIQKRHRPDLYIVSLGTNDGQALFYRTAKGGKRWAKLWNPKHTEIYGKRVTRMLERLSGKNRSRPIVWIGPTGHPNAKFNRRMRYLSDIIKARIDAFDGPVAYIDGLSATLDPTTGKPRQRVTPAGHKNSRRALQSDDMHLNWQGARWLLAEPVLKLIGPCLPARG